MKIEFYQLYRNFNYTNFLYPIVLDVLKLWSESAGWHTNVSIREESKVNLSTDADVVAITVYTQTANAAYRLSDKLRARGKIVVLGGPHFKGANHIEAMSRCDVVVKSICEDQWLQLLEWIELGKIQPGGEKSLYIEDIEGRFAYPDNLYQSFKSHKWYQIPLVATSLGCPYDCDFCSPYLPGKYQLRDIDTVKRELSHARGPITLVSDASFGLNKRYTIELMQAVAPLGKSVGVETTLSRLQDTELLDALAMGGVKMVAIGIESLSLSLGKHGQGKLKDSLKRLLDEAHQRGILVQGNFVFGFDCDEPSCFEEVYRDFSEVLDIINPVILVPYPHTRIYQQLHAEGRIIDYDWEHYDSNHVVFKPLNMSVDQLTNGLIELKQHITGYDFIRKKVRQIFSHVGFTKSSAFLVGHYLLHKLVANRQESVLRANQLQIEKILAGTEDALQTEPARPRNREGEVITIS